MPMTPLFLSLFYSFVVAFGSSGYTKEFVKQTQYRPLLTHECYRTDVSFEPEGSVNFTVLWDGTNRNDYTGVVTSWYAPNGTRDQYTKSSAEYEYDEASGTFKVTQGSYHSQCVELIAPFNGLAYYRHCNITSQNNRKAWKILDVDPSCGNAAALHKLIDPDGKKGFVFSRDVPEPTRRCVQVSLCPPKAVRPPNARGVRTSHRFRKYK